MVEVREARAEELGIVGELLVEAYREYFPVEYGSDEERDGWEHYREDLQDTVARAETSIQLVAVQQDRIVGAVTYYPPGAYEQGGDAAAGWSGIRLLAVEPPTRGQGIGRMLTEACLARAKSEGAEGITLHTTEIMAVARAMYERMGFVRAPHLDFYPIEDSDFTVLAYRLRLG